MESEKKFKIKWQEILYLIIGYIVLIKVIVFNINFFTHNKHTFGKLYIALGTLVLLKF